MTEAPSRRVAPAVYPPVGRPGLSAAAEEILQDVQVVFEQLRAHVQGFTYRYPARLVGVIAAAHRRQLAGGEFEVETVGDGAAALAAVGVVEDLLALQ